MIIKKCTKTRRPPFGFSAATCRLWRTRRRRRLPAPGGFRACRTPGCCHASWRWPGRPWGWCGRGAADTQATTTAISHISRKKENAQKVRNWTTWTVVLLTKLWVWSFKTKAKQTNKKTGHSFWDAGEIWSEFHWRRFIGSTHRREHNQHTNTGIQAWSKTVSLLTASCVALFSSSCCTLKKTLADPTSPESSTFSLLFTAGC